LFPYYAILFDNVSIINVTLKNQQAWAIEPPLEEYLMEAWVTCFFMEVSNYQFVLKLDD
jgi:hypothetical protein